MLKAFPPVFLLKIFLLFGKTKNGLEPISLSHFLHVIYNKMFLMLYSITE